MLVNEIRVQRARQELLVFQHVQQERNVRLNTYISQRSIEQVPGNVNELRK